MLIISAYCVFTIPISETGIPFTLQSLVVFVLGGMLRPKEIATVIILYLLLGSIGLPVFAEGSAGFSKLTGASGGFLYGFFFSSVFIAIILSRYKGKGIVNLGGVMLLATIILFVFGLSHLAVKFGLSKAITYGLVPFWKMALVKALLAAIILFFYWKFALKSNKVKVS